MGGRAKASILDGIDLTRITEDQAKGLFDRGKAAVVFIILTLSAKLAETERMASPSTPSSQIPPYAKPNGSQRKKSSGRGLGHPGTHRKLPERIDRTETHSLKVCPNCGDSLPAPAETRTRFIEDIPETQPEVVEHVIPRCYCKRCGKYVEPIVPDALPQAHFGHRMIVLTSWLHYGLGLTLSQIVKVLSVHFQFTVTASGLIQAWHRLADILLTWYDEIANQALESATLHADETGHRIHGVTHWLWCFANSHLTYYQIDPSRGEPALQGFFVEAFAGVLITDFWAAYNKVIARKRQMCLVHLLRELVKVDLHNNSPPWVEFRTRLKRLLLDAIRLSKREDCPAEEFTSKRKRLDLRLKELIATNSHDKDAKRLLKRLKRHKNDLFTFLDEPDVTFDNNLAEREIRPAVMMRKNSFHNMSQNGAITQAIIMTVYRTLQRRGHDPLNVLVEALRTFVLTGSLPPLPSPIIPSDD